MTAWRLGLPVRLAAVVATLVTLSFSRPARSSEFVLVWDAPPECPRADVVRKQVLKRVGAQRGDLALKVHAAVTREELLFRVRLHTYRAGQRGLRTLEAPTCSALVDAIAVIVALAVGETLPEETSGSEGSLVEQGRTPRRAATAKNERAAAPGTAAAAAAETEAVDPDARAPMVQAGPAPNEVATAASPSPPPPGDRESAAPPNTDSKPAVIDDSGDTTGRAFTDLGLQGVASLAGSVESGVLPGLGFGVTLRGGARFRRIRVEGALSRWFARQAQSSTPGRGADVDGMSLATWGCFRAVPGHTAPVPRLRSALPPDDAPAIEAGPCLGVELGQLHARSFGVSDAGSGSASYAALGGGLRLGATASDWLSLDVRFEALRVLHRPEFRVENLGVVHEPALWSLRAALGAEAYFP